MKAARYTLHAARCTKAAQSRSVICEILLIRVICDKKATRCTLQERLRKSEYNL